MLLRLPDISDLKDVELFRGLSESALSELLQLTSILEYTPGQQVFREGDIGDAMFLILSGEIRISKNIHGVGEEALAFLKEGSYFGEMALVGEETPRSASAVCESRAELAKLSRQEFVDMLHRRPDVGVQVLWSFVSTLSGRLRESNERMAFFAMSNMFE